MKNINIKISLNIKQSVSNYMAINNTSLKTNLKKLKRKYNTILIKKNNILQLKITVFI